MKKRPRIYGKKVATIYLNGNIIGTCTVWNTLSTTHLPTLETYLQDAVDSEEYEFAAEIRDRIIEVKNIKPITGPDIEYNLDG